MLHQLVKANSLIDLLSGQFSPGNVVIGITWDTAHKTVHKLFRPEVLVRRLLKPSPVMRSFQELHQNVIL
jgi:hypothetical protein